MPRCRDLAIFMILTNYDNDNDNKRWNRLLYPFVLKCTEKACRDASCLLSLYADSCLYTFSSCLPLQCYTQLLFNAFFPSEQSIQHRQACLYPLGHCNFIHCFLSPARIMSYYCAHPEVHYSTTMIHMCITAHAHGAE